MKQGFLSLIIVLFGCIMEAQTPFQRKHTLFSGKENYDVEVILQDAAGFIWFGTDRGLFRFDGITYEAFTVSDGLADDRISSICAIHEELMWIGHKNGNISIYDGSSFSVFQPEEGMGKVEITDIIMGKNRMIWFSTLGEGIYRYDGRHMANFNMDDGLSDDYVYDIEIDNTGNLWLATDYGFCQYNGQSFRGISMKDGLPDNIIRSLQFDGERIWLGTDESGLSSYDPVGGGLINYGNWSYGPVTGIVRSHENEIWAGTEREGMVKVEIRDDSTAMYQQLTEEHGLISNLVHAVVKDFEENVWIGGRRGVVQILPPVFEFLEARSGMPFQTAFSLLKDIGGSLWVSSEKGLFKGVRNMTGQWEWISISDHMGMQNVSFISLYEDPLHRIWAGTYGRGLFILHPESLEYQELNRMSGLSDENVIHISGDREMVWISTLGGGINQFELSTSELRHVSHPDIAESYVYAAQTDYGERVWIAGLLEFPYYITQDSIQHFKDTSFVFPPLYGIACDSFNGNWFNTLDQGVIRINENKVETYGPDEGLDLQEIQSIVFDKFNNLLIYANTGLQIYNPVDGRSILFDENMGLGYRYPQLNSVYRDRAEQIWFGTETGIIKYNPDYLHITDQQPRLFLSTMNLFDTPVDTTRSTYRHRNNNFTFGFTGFWYKNPEKLVFRYQLEGHDPDWNYYERNRTVAYPKLHPGYYTFRAEISVDGLTWCTPEEAAYSFRILPPVWKRWWFILIMVCLVVTGIWVYIRIRLANLARAKERLEKEVKNRTEQIVNKNMELEAQKEEIATQRDFAEEQRDQIELQKEEIQSSIRYAYRIQTAAMPPEPFISELLEEYFIFNRPRDIVSGDFYWAARTDM